MCEQTLEFSNCSRVKNGTECVSFGALQVVLHYGETCFVVTTKFTLDLGGLKSYLA